MSIAPALLLILTILGAPDHQAPAKILKASEAIDHIGQVVTVEMTVKASKNGSGRKTYFLDSEGDYKLESNLAVLISHDDMATFREAGIDDPARHFKGKTIRVTGKVIDEENQIRIRVTRADQIVPVEK